MGLEENTGDNRSDDSGGAFGTIVVDLSESTNIRRDHPSTIGRLSLSTPVQTKVIIVLENGAYT